MGGELALGPFEARLVSPDIGQHIILGDSFRPRTTREVMALEVLPHVQGKAQAETEQTAPCSRGSWAAARALGGHPGRQMTVLWLAFSIGTS